MMNLPDFERVKLALANLAGTRIGWLIDLMLEYLQLPVVFLMNLS